MNEIEILQQHAAKLLAKANVLGVGIGHKLRRGIRLPGQCLTVLVSEKQPLTALSQADLIPVSLGGMRTDVVQTGRLHPFEQTERERPAQPGLSVGHYQVTAGTFGATVYDKTSGEPLILSNNHVLANSSSSRQRRAYQGDPILQPGSYDGGKLATDVIGRLERYVPLSFAKGQSTEMIAASAARQNWRVLSTDPVQASLNSVDAAVAKPIQPDMISPEILGIGPVTGTATAELDLTVQKSGRTTGYTKGTVLIKNVIMRVDYGEAGECVFTNQLVSDIVSGPGDSGSLVLDMQGRAVGLLFAGGDDITVLNPIADVLQQLGIVFST